MFLPVHSGFIWVLGAWGRWSTSGALSWVVFPHSWRTRWHFCWLWHWFSRIWCFRFAWIFYPCPWWTCGCCRICWRKWRRKFRLGSRFWLLWARWKKYLERFWDHRYHRRWWRHRPYCSSSWWCLWSVPVRRCPRFPFWRTLPRSKLIWIGLDLLEPKINSDGWNVELVELVISKSFEEGRLPHCRRPHQHHLYDIIILPEHLINYPIS